ncbi:response regulator [Rathayibacter soli]|uniref:response regulator n=1 Tax=Rathayibacter soli TaxID=3144168 RepID=UPI0027E5AAE5|nr:response regulator [Glaciibacter superstes]
MTDQPLTVLVVDDDYRVASVHVGFVERIPGFRVVGQAHTATDALALAESAQPDLVLMDVYLPDGDGLQVVRTLLDTPSPPAVIVISAASDVATVRLAVQLGAVHYLVKPFGFSALAERLTAFRDAHAHIAELPDEATQDDVNRLFDLLRPPSRTHQAAGLGNLAPTLQLVYDAISASGSSLSASQIAANIGISRATAQRYLTQLEQSNIIKLELRYGSTGRPEHLYSIKRRTIG